MNISYLPNELLADILDRLDIDSVFQCRKTNKRFNNIIKTYKLFKPVTNLLSIRWENNQRKNVEIIAETFLEKKKIVMKSLISVEENNKIEEIEDKIIKHLEKLRIPSTRIFETNSDELNFDRILRAANINLSHLHCFLSSTGGLHLSLVDNLTLETMVTNKTTNVQMGYSTTNFTLDGIVTAIQELSKIPQTFFWNLGHINTGVKTEHAAKEVIRKLKISLESMGAELTGSYNITVTLKNTNSKVKWSFVEKQYLGLNSFEL